MNDELYGHLPPWRRPMLYNEPAEPTRGPAEEEYPTPPAVPDNRDDLFDLDDEDEIFDGLDHPNNEVGDQ